MNIKKTITIGLFFVIQSALAISLSIPKPLIDIGVTKKFPKEKLTITLDKPTTKFSKERQKIELCGVWASKLPQRTGEFCVDTQPVWNKEKGDIEISKVNILKLTAADCYEHFKLHAFNAIRWNFRLSRARHGWKATRQY